MEETLKKIEEQLDEIKLFSEFLEIYGDPKIASEKMFYKNLEDGILSSISNASITQLKTLKRSHRFKFYSEDQIDKIIDSEIIKRERRDKINKIVNNE